LGELRFLFLYLDENAKFDCPTRRESQPSLLGYDRAKGQALKPKVWGQSHQGYKRKAGFKPTFFS
jgi:hypothetical protein